MLSCLTDNFLTMSNETLIENIGNEMNITTSTTTKRKPKSIGR